ncbi:sugar transferase [Pontibacter anaerobius]|uniref:Sugar transferase n=1 Tax=Pontibacter anaerobius TaxID=2993940 RepID=A0ABT3REV0_9BACT|nr:sugar transferase [Pontibacter anaerobius]MCX2739933.1 sugar transferase [Pontibacter anaerobius]
MEIYLPPKTISKSLVLRDPQQYGVKRKKCLIIYPGDIASEFLKEPGLTNFYTVDCWDGTAKTDFATTLSSAKYDVVLLDPSSNITLDKSQLKFINDLRVKQVSVYNLASFHENFTKRIPLAHFKSWLINSDMFFVSSRQAFLIQKRFIDMLMSLILAPFALFLVLLAIVGIKCTSKGPAFFIQNRVGMKGRTFKIFKLRTMYHTPESTNNSHTVVNDVRITPIGRILRKTKIDELPQLYNILCGHMSLIGPRPEKEEIVAKLVDDAPYYNLRHSIRPGVTGWAQVNYPTATPEHNMQKLEYDLFYVKNASLILDFKILIQTVRVVFTMNSL